MWRRSSEVHRCWGSAPEAPDRCGRGGRPAQTCNGSLHATAHAHDGSLQKPGHTHAQRHRAQPPSRHQSAEQQHQGAGEQQRGNQPQRNWAARAKLTPRRGAPSRGAASACDSRWHVNADVRRERRTSPPASWVVASSSSVPSGFSSRLLRPVVMIFHSNSNSNFEFERKRGLVAMIFSQTFRSNFALEMAGGLQHATRVCY